MEEMTLYGDDKFKMCLGSVYIAGGVGVVVDLLNDRVSQLIPLYQSPARDQIFTVSGIIY